MKTNPHLKIVSRLLKTLYNIQYLKNEYRFNLEDTEVKKKISHEVEWYKALKERFCALPIEENTQNTNIELEGIETSLHIKKF